MKDREYLKSEELLRKSQKIIPAKTQTFSKGPQAFGNGRVPHYLYKGYGSRVVDVDGNEYIDYSMNGVCNIRSC